MDSSKGKRLPTLSEQTVYFVYETWERNNDECSKKNFRTNVELKDLQSNIQTQCRISENKVKLILVFNVLATAYW